MLKDMDIVPSVVVLGLFFVLFFLPAFLCHITKERRPHHKGPWGRLYDREIR